MKILGNTPDGDLIIQVSQAEWDGLRDGVKPIPESDSALAVLREEHKVCTMRRLGKLPGKPNQKLTQAINSSIRWIQVNRDMPFDEFLEKLKDPYFSMQVRSFGPELARILIEHLSNERTPRTLPNP